MNQCKVIVIDDDLDFRSVIPEFLNMNSINVLTTGCNGKDAVELYKQYCPDVVLMDLNMSEYDGFYGLENLQRIYSDVKVIIITGNNDVEIKKRLLELGSTIILKSFKINHVIETIHKLTIHSSIDPLVT